MIKKIKNKGDYESVMSKIDALMAKGSDKATTAELAEIRALALSAQAYEQQVYVIEQPDSLSGMIEMRMFEMKIKQADMAKKLHVSPAKLSLILNGKQRVDIDFLKAVHKELNVDADFLLAHV
ncbi:DNA-binding protein [Pedobacter sp. BMA]|nr:DNA-binding protein [Pedobacter sp. BMA]